MVIEVDYARNLNGIYFSFDTKITDGQFNVGINNSPEWIHVTMNYMGPEDGQGIRIYRDGRGVAEDKEKTSSSMAAPRDGMIVAGRLFTNTYNLYATFNLDELLFFNSVLNEEVNAIYKL